MFSRKDAKECIAKAQKMSGFQLGEKGARISNSRMNENEIAYNTIGVALKLHSQLGPGLLESIYETAFAHDLYEAGFDIKKQIPVSFLHRGIKMESAYRIDILY